MGKYSIILRAYNAEKKISRSIESIISQSYENWELIIVNDGSSDCTKDIAINYAVKDKRIKVFNQENSGCVLATQNGVNNATGEYICVLDADDWYERDYLQCVDNAVEKYQADMFVVNFNILDLKKKVQDFCLFEEETVTDCREAMKKFLKTTNYALWNKVVRRELICYADEVIEFFNIKKKETNFGEDLYQLMPVLCQCKEICFINECLYNYVIDEGSISHKAEENHWNELSKRNQLMQFTYDILKKSNYLDSEIVKIIRDNTNKIIMSSVVSIIKTRKIDKIYLRELGDNLFFTELLKTTKFNSLKNEFGLKKAIAYKVFGLLI